MNDGVGSLLRVYLLALVGIASALIPIVRDRGCIIMDKKPVCAGREEKYIWHQGELAAGFPPTTLPPETRPLCKVNYDIPMHWTYVIFDVDDWCLKGVNGQVVVCCDRKTPYGGPLMPSPYNLMNEGSSQTDGKHDTTWEEAFPLNLKPPSYVQPPSIKSLKDTKLFSSTSPENDAFSYDSTTAPPQQLQVSYDDINMGQQTNPPLVASSDANVNAAAADSTFNPNPVIQPFVPEIHAGDVPAGNAPFLSSFNTPDLTAQAFEGDVFGV